MLCEMQVVNKYLLADGACPKSYGPTVARAAGVPVSVTKRAAEISEQFEQGNLPVKQLSAIVPPRGFKEVWVACNGSSVPDLACLQRLQAEISCLESAVP
jgi:DNA mismatch repair ATPase MutS